MMKYTIISHDTSGDGFFAEVTPGMPFACPKPDDFESSNNPPIEYSSIVFVHHCNVGQGIPRITIHGVLKLTDGTLTYGAFGSRIVDGCDVPAEAMAIQGYQPATPQGKISQKPSYVEGLLDAMSEIDAEIECINIEYADSEPCRKAAYRALANAKILIRDLMTMSALPPSGGL